MHLKLVMQKCTAWIVGRVLNLLPSSDFSFGNKHDGGSRGMMVARNAAVANAQRKSVNIKPSTMIAG
jgi:hypothetical protein